eukprot:10754550-Alexandrium_andersonii.AAC.1
MHECRDQQDVLGPHQGHQDPGNEDGALGPDAAPGEEVRRVVAVAPDVARPHQAQAVQPLPN